VRFFFSFFLSVSAVAVATVLSVFKLAATIAPAFCFVLFFFFFLLALSAASVWLLHICRFMVPLSAFQVSGLRSPHLSLFPAR
jgi:hypothetical protein